MSRVHLEQDIKPLSEFRAGVTSCIRQISETGRPLMITEGGKDVAVVLHADEYEAMREKLELLDEMLAAESQLTMDEVLSTVGYSGGSERQKKMKSE